MQGICRDKKPVNPYISRLYSYLQDDAPNYTDIAEKPIKVLYRTLYRTKVNFSSRDSLHLSDGCRDQMQVSVIGSHDTGIFQKKRTLPTYIRIKKARKKISIAQKGLNNVYKNNYNTCIFLYRQKYKIMLLYVHKLNRHMI